MSEWPTLSVQQFLERIELDAVPRPTLPFLQRLHQQYQLTTPFENFDIILLDRPILLDIERIYDKIVNERRGGFCYELNGLLAAMLMQIGYSVELGCGRWFEEDGSLGALFDHLVLAVGIPGTPDRWLADCGAGRQTPPLPLALQSGIVQEHPSFPVRHRLEAIDTSGFDWIVHWQHHDEPWEPVYQLDLRPRQFTDYQDRCDWLQYSPDSPFRRGPICSRVTPTGRISISANRLIVTEDGVRSETTITGDLERNRLLEKWFGVILQGRTLA